ncbi:MAG: PEGA domain-containing protein [Deltaproteobacteria bacterium]|nr:PEGA domain-containing protein [Deltaproteobacteria bacterium]MBW1873905.1 PEGA domain-containing protein [Deltaproteobacteria bacterium]MBW2381445.1 PEGA domain-containing protein [Deltaproteobacteria bacterium]MBW2684333.1 PEGA domain-containing protein [Deltaproteobacteria bacterium]
MRLVVLALLSLLASAAQVSAQLPTEQEEATSLPSDAELSEFLANPSTTAVEAYQVGVRLFEAKHYEGAESAWLRAYSLGRDPNLLVAVADTRQRRGDEPGAVAMLEQYLVERPDAPDRTSIAARIATLLQSPAVLSVRSAQPGHAILLDGIPVEKKTPADLEVEPGTHTVLVVGEGTHVGEKTVQVGYGEVKQLDFAPDATSEVVVAQSEQASLQAQLAIEREDTAIRRAVISTGSISAAALLTGTVLGFLAIQKEQDYRDNPTEGTADKGERFALVADVSFGLAALSAITSFTLFMTHKNKRKRERESAHLRIETRGAGATAILKF